MKSQFKKHNKNENNSGSSLNIWNTPPLFLIDVTNFVQQAKQYSPLVKEDGPLVDMSELSVIKK